MARPWHAVKVVAYNTNAACHAKLRHKVSLCCSFCRQKLLPATSTTLQDPLHCLRQDISSSYNSICAARGLALPALIDGRLPAAAAAVAAAASPQQLQPTLAGAYQLGSPATARAAGLVDVSIPIAGSLQISQLQHDRQRQQLWNSPGGLLQAAPLLSRPSSSLAGGYSSTALKVLSASNLSMQLSPAAGSSATAAAAVAQSRSPAQLQQQMRAAYSGLNDLQHLSQVRNRGTPNAAIKQSAAVVFICLGPQLQQRIKKLALTCSINYVIRVLQALECPWKETDTVFRCAGCCWHTVHACIYGILQHTGHITPAAAAPL